jgi:signal transduction histidine kinase/CheY-like chemotaxis protein
MVIISIVLIITAATLALGLFYSQNRFWDVVKADLNFSSTLAAELVSSKIAFLKKDAAAMGEKLFSVPSAMRPALLEQFLMSSPFLAVSIFNRRGWLYYSGHGAPDNSYVENPYFKRALEGETVISSPEWESGGNLVIRLYTPLADSPRPCDEVLIVTLPGMTIRYMVADYRIWETGTIFIVNGEGTIIASPRSERVRNHYNYINMARENPVYASIGDTVSRMIRGETGTSTFSINGIEQFCSFRSIPGADGWALGTTAPIRESPVSQIRQVLLISSALFLFLGIIAAFSAANSIAVPFKKIEEQNQKLEELKLAAESASETKSNFLANMSHEMRTPLNAIIGFSELTLDSGEIFGEASSNLEKIHNSGMNLLGIINDILDISKIESGKFELIPVEYDIPSLINDTAVLNTTRIGSKPIQFRLHADKNLPAVLFGDELRIKQIFNNLLSNAFKYTAEGTVDWDIHAEEDPISGPGGIWLVSSVRDTGIGIKQEDVGKLFQDYNQVNTRSNRKIEGTGLGLSLAKKMADLMGGTIALESEYGKGSIFTVRLRQQRRGEAVIGNEKAESLSNFHYNAQKRSQNQKLIRIPLPYASVLVVDDVAANLEVTRGLLKPYGMTVDCVSSGQSAINRIKNPEKHYNAIFMDHMMPGMDGMEAVRIIRKEIDTGYAKTIPIIALTANAIVGTEEIFLRNGFQAFLTKPIDIMRLDSVIHQWVRDKKREQELDGGGEENTRRGEDTASRRQIPLIKAGMEIPGMDLMAALNLFEGDEESLLSVMEAYVAHTPAYLESLRTFQAGDNGAAFDDYVVRVHGIKSSSRSIGALETGRKAEDLEHAGRRRDVEFIRVHGVEFVEETDRLVTEIRRFLEKLKLKTEKPAKDRPDPKILERIIRACRDYDMERLEESISLLDQYNYREDPELVSLLREQSGRSDFEGILKGLSKFITASP